MDITFKIPDRQLLLSHGCEMYVALKGETWQKECLGQYADKRGVYVHRNGSQILYVGQTVKGKWGTFSERLRREFQETSSQNSRLYQFLVENAVDGLYTICFDLTKRLWTESP